MGVLAERIAALRKERGLTQEQLGKMTGVSAQAVSKWEKGGAPDVELLPVLAEQLGVTIDGLFGLEAGERVDVAEVVGRWLSSFPNKERYRHFCKLVWNCGQHFSPVNLEFPKAEYLQTCRPDSEHSDQLIYTQLGGEGGQLMDVHAEDLSFVTIFPEPKEGYAAYFVPMEKYRRLFALLAEPYCLELLEELHRRKGQYFVPAAMAAQTDIPEEKLTALLEELTELTVLHSITLEVSEGEIKAYKLAEPLTLVPLLFTAQSFMQNGMNYFYFFDDDFPPLRGAKWEKEDKSNEKA